MGAVTGFATKSQVTGVSITNPAIVKHTAAVGGTEYSVTLPANTKQYQIFWSGGGEVRLGSVAGGIALGDFVSLPKHSWVAQGGITAPSVILYYESSTPGSTITIYSWS